MTKKRDRKAPTIELRPDENQSRRNMIDGEPTMDEIVAWNAYVHFEMMDSDSLWGRIDSGGKSVRIWITARKNRLLFTAEFE